MVYPWSWFVFQQSLAHHSHFLQVQVKRRWTSKWKTHTHVDTAWCKLTTSWENWTVCMIPSSKWEFTQAPQVTEMNLMNHVLFPVINSFNWKESFNLDTLNKSRLVLHAAWSLVLLQPNLSLGLVYVNQWIYSSYVFRILTHQYHQGVHSMQSLPLPCFLESREAWLSCKLPENKSNSNLTPQF